MYHKISSYNKSSSFLHTRGSVSCLNMAFICGSEEVLSVCAYMQTPDNSDFMTILLFLLWIWPDEIIPPWSKCYKSEPGLYLWTRRSTFCCVSLRQEWFHVNFVISFVDINQCNHSFLESMLHIWTWLISLKQRNYFLLC